MCVLASLLQAMLGKHSETKPLAGIIRRVQGHEREKLTVVRAKPQTTLATQNVNVTSEHGNRYDSICFFDVCFPRSFYAW